MLPSLPQDRAPRRGRWRMAFLAGLTVAVVAGSTLLVLPQARVEAQSQGLPPGAPTSFADLVEHVKPAVVSIQVTSQGPKIARIPQDPHGQDPKARPGPHGQVPPDEN